MISSIWLQNDAWWLSTHHPHTTFSSLMGCLTSNFFSVQLQTNCFVVTILMIQENENSIGSLEENRTRTMSS
jgi:hypothetical protein